MDRPLTPVISHHRARLNPAAPRWIDLDLHLLRTRSPDEWRRAHALAKAIALRWIAALGGDLDDAIQEALTALDAELGRLEKNAVPPSCALCTIFFQKATHMLRSRRSRDALRERLPGEPQLEPTRPDAELDGKQLAQAFETALHSELESSARSDREILQGMLLGRSGREIAGLLGLAESTVCERKSGIVERLRGRLRSTLDATTSSALFTTGGEK